MNAFLFRAQVYDLLTDEGLSVDSAVRRLRHDHREWLTQVSGPQLTKDVKEIADQVEAASSPVASAYLAMHFSEMQLRGELSEVLARIAPTGPAQTRELVQLIGQLGQRESGGVGQQAPQELVDAIEAVGGETDDRDYRAWLEELYPSTIK